MSCCSDIKFHGYFIGAMAGLLELISLIISGYVVVSYSDPNESELPKDLIEMVSFSLVDYVADLAMLISVGILLYGIYKESRYCLVPFMVAICYDWVSYLAHNINRAMPYHVWLLTTAFFVYIFVAMLSLFILFGMKIKTVKNDRFAKFQIDSIA